LYNDDSTCTETTKTVAEDVLISTTGPLPGVNQNNNVATGENYFDSYRCTSDYLDSPEVWLDEWNVAGLLEEVDGAGMIHAWRQHQQKVVEKKRLVVQVELQRAVVDLDVCDLRDHVLEVALFPRVRRVVHHRNDGIVVLFVFVVEEHKLRPQVGLIGRTQDLLATCMNIQQSVKPKFHLARHVTSRHDKFDVSSQSSSTQPKYRGSTRRTCHVKT